jgi:hypothetical protein
MTKITETIEALLAKAVSAEKSDDAMKFTQAALNAANAGYHFGVTPKKLD